jgi:hypothetical protein
MRTLVAVCALALPIPAVVAGCGGGGGNEEDPQQVLQETFAADHDTKVSSGVLDISANVSAGDQGTFSASLKGPFQTDPSNPTSVPQLDLTATATGDGGGQSLDFNGGLVVTDDNAYVEYKNKTYELGTAAFKKFQAGFEKASEKSSSKQDSSQSFSQQCAAAVEQAGGDASVCDVDFASWMTNLSNEGTEDVGGTTTIHISGDADVQQIANDLIAIVQQTAPQQAGRIDPNEVSLVSKAITNAHIDVFTGEDDKILRKADLSLTVDPSKLRTGSIVPLPEITVDVTVAINDLNSKQTIEAPTGAKPIGGLLRLLGVAKAGPLAGMGNVKPDVPALTGGGNGGGNGGGGSSAGGGGSDTSTPPPAGGDGGGGGILGIDPSQLEGADKQTVKYFQCISQAAGDASALQACNSILK